jgi:hypothetical protein
LPRLSSLIVTLDPLDKHTLLTSTHFGCVWDGVRIPEQSEAEQAIEATRLASGSGVMRLECTLPDTRERTALESVLYKEIL